MVASIRYFGEQDVSFALTQTAREGWDTTAALFQALLLHDPDGSFLAEWEGHRAGMITTTRYAQSAWIGNLIVSPERRRRGVGERLMRHAMAHLFQQGVRTIRLEADAPGVRLYRRLGFVEEFESLRFRGSCPGRPDDSGIRPLSPDDLPAVRAFDVEYFGDDRGRLLGLLFRMSRAACWLRTGREVCGYAMVLPSAWGVRLGPWVAVDRDTAGSLLGSILLGLPATTVVVGIPGVNCKAVELVEGCGFSRTPSSLRMVYGDRAARGCPGRIYAIANGATG